MKKILILSLLFAATQALWAQEKIAVFPFEVPNNVISTRIKSARQGSA